MTLPVALTIVFWVMAAIYLLFLLALAIAPLIPGIARFFETGFDSHDD